MSRPSTCPENPDRYTLTDVGEREAGSGFIHFTVCSAARRFSSSFRSKNLRISRFGIATFCLSPYYSLVTCQGPSC